jgi:ferredoxin-thioredoxin reductase catalytic subunit
MTEKQTVIDAMQKNAKENGYHLCPDKQLFSDLIDGLVTNTNRYGYGSCPCRVASGVKKNDVDIICPCEYRDADVDEFGMCYCGLFVDKNKRDNPSEMGPIPERRPPEITDAALAAAESPHREVQKSTEGKIPTDKQDTSIPVWRCTVCGYLCARDMPPPICPICKAKSERFERFTLR